MRRIKHYIQAFIFLALFFLLVVLSNLSSWWKFSTRGEIYSSLSLYGRDIYFGNNLGEVFAVDNKTGKEKWKYQAEEGIASGPILHNSFVIFTTSQGGLYVLKAKTGEEVWRFINPDLFGFYTEPQIKKGTVYIGDAGGTLYAVDLKRGNLKWKFATNPVDKLEKILVAGRLHWFGSFRIRGSSIYIASRDGTLYSVSSNKGKLKWKFDSGKLITSAPVVTATRVFFGNKEGENFELARGSGRLIRQSKENSAPTCIEAYKKTLLPWRTYLIEVYEDGKIIRRDDGEKVWEIATDDKELFCPLKWGNILYSVGYFGFLRAFDIRDGSQKWSLKLADVVGTFPAVHYSLFQLDLLAGKIIINTPFFYFGEGSGKFYALNARNGKEIWTFNAFSKINGTPKVSGRFVYFASSDGGLYKVRRLDGKIQKSLFARLVPRVTQDIKKVGQNEIIELSIQSDDSIFTNPIREVGVRATFVHESGSEFLVRGFYYSEDIWKVRFNPPKKGMWKWELLFEYPGKSYVTTGEFESQTDTANSFIKVSDKNKRRLTLDGENIFNGLGIQNSTVDYNYNGNPFDDWAVGEDELLIATSSGRVNYFKSNNIVDSSEYLRLHKDEGGFNLYRWGFGNTSFTLWEHFEDTTKVRFLVGKAKLLDSFFESLKENEYHTILTLFSFDIPFSNNPWQIEKKVLENYIEYIVARYQAYVDIWEIGNEVYAHEDVVNLIARKIKEQDLENRPITLSWERPEYEEIDIVSPHWFETEPLSASDIRVSQLVTKFKKFDKPIVIGEQGNTERSWDETSATRLRVRAWSSFFNEAILVLWSESSDRNYYNSILLNANIFIGAEERKYLRVLQDFTKNISLSAKVVTLRHNNSSVRSYGLQSEKEILGYFFHYGNIGTLTSMQISLNLPRKGTLIFIDPATGEELKKQNLPSAGFYQVTSPVFRTDLALKVEFEQN